VAREGQELVVITKAYDLVLWSCHHTSRFPRSRRFVLGERIERRAVRPAGDARPPRRGQNTGRHFTTPATVIRTAPRPPPLDALQQRRRGTNRRQAQERCSNRRRSSSRRASSVSSRMASSGRRISSRSRASSGWQGSRNIQARLTMRSDLLRRPAGRRAPGVGTSALGQAHPCGGAPCARVEGTGKMATGINEAAETGRLP
jgi:hypothetical protein